MKPSRIFIPSLALLAAVSACAWLSPSAPSAPTATPARAPAAALTSTPLAPPAGAPTEPRIRTRATATPATPTAPAPTAPAASAAAPTPAAPTAAATYPPPNPAYPLLTVTLQAVQVSDNNGQRAARITPEQVGQWVAKANAIFAKASVRFIYDPSADFATLKSTVLNDMAGDTDPNWNREVETGNRIAASYAGKLTVYFIYGSGPGPTGGGFSWVAYNFVEMPGFNDTQVCGYQNTGILAHEVGHYFGLSHPFVQTFASLPAAELYFTAHGRDPEAFDGDGLSDTPPDPFIDIPAFQCGTTPSVTLDGQLFPLPRLNIMSYYSNPGIDRTDLTPQQSAIVRWVLGLRAKNGLATPTNLGLPGAVEFEGLPITDPLNVAPQVQDMSNFGDAPRWSKNKQLFSNAQPDSRIGFTISVPAAGKYQLDLYATLAPDYGALQTLLDGKPLGAPFDLYGPLVLPTGRLPIGPVTLTAGPHTLGFHVVGKDTASLAFSFGLDAYTLTPE